MIFLKNITFGHIRVSSMTTSSLLKKLNICVKISVYMDLNLPKEEPCSMHCVAFQAVSFLEHVCISCLLKQI